MRPGSRTVVILLFSECPRPRTPAKELFYTKSELWSISQPLKTSSKEVERRLFIRITKGACIILKRDTPFEQFHLRWQAIKGSSPRHNFTFQRNPTGPVHLPAVSINRPIQIINSVVLFFFFLIIYLSCHLRLNLKKH